MVWVLIAETHLISTHNVCFLGETRKKYYVDTPLLSGALEIITVPLLSM